METETHHLVVNTARLKALSTTLYIVVYCILCSCCSMPILHPTYDVVRSVNEATLATTPFDFEFRVPAGQKQNSNNNMAFGGNKLPHPHPLLRST